MKRRKWALEEHEILRRLYPQHGARTVQASLAKAGFHRTRYAIYCEAHKRDVMHAHFKRQVPLVYLTNCDWTKRTRTYKRAVKDGVLRKVGHGRNARYIVPEWWADQEAERIAAELDHDQAIRSWWYTGRAAREYGLPGAQLREVIRSGYPKSLEPFTRVKRVKDSAGNWRWHPTETTMKAREYKLKHAPKLREAA